MGIAIWSDRYRTGHPLIDRQHQELFQMINNLHAGIIAGNRMSVMGSTLEHLFRYTLRHFQAEETLMFLIDYPDIHIHKKTHEELARQTERMLEAWKAGELVPTIALSDFLADWLCHHIQENDMALIEYVRFRATHAV